MTAARRIAIAEQLGLTDAVYRITFEDGAAYVGISARVCNRAYGAAFRRRPVGAGTGA